MLHKKSTISSYNYDGGTSDGHPFQGQTNVLDLIPPMEATVKWWQ